MGDANTMRSGRSMWARVAASLVAAVALAATVAVAAGPAGATPSEEPDDLWVTNGRVRAVTQVGDHIYLGGGFTRVGPATGHAVFVDPDTGQRTPSSPHVDGVVLAAIPDGAGGWYLGGQFAAVNGIGRSNVAHVTADGTVSPWNPFTNAPVRALVRTADAVVLAGDFTTVRTAPRARVAAVHPVTAAPRPGWAPAVNGRVNAAAITPDGSRLVIGGAFTSVDGVPRGRLAILDATTGSVDALFAASPNRPVHAVDVSPDGERVYLGGDFTFVGLLPRQRVAAVSTETGALDLTFGASADNTVRAVRAHPDGTRVLLGGRFTRLSGVSRGRFGAVDAAGTTLPWAAFATGSVESIAISPDGEDAIVGGFFSSLARTPAVFAGRVSTLDGTPVGSFDVQANAVVWTVGWQGDTVLLGGGFTSVGSVRQPYLARLHADTGELDTSFRPTLDNQIITLAATDDGTSLYAGGQFLSVNGQPRGRGAAWDLRSDRLTAWDPGADEEITVVLPADGKVFIGGWFTRLERGNLHRFLARTDPDTGVPDPLWQPLPNGPVQALADDPASSGIYVGGRFSMIGLGARRNVAHLNQNGMPTAFDVGSPAIVHSLDTSPTGHLLYVAIGGNNDVGGNAVAGYATAGTGSIRWKHQGNGDVQVVHAGDDATLWVGGHFRHMRSPSDVRRGIAALDGPTGALKPFAPELFWSDLGVWDIETTASGLLVGGDQQRVGTHGLEGIVRFPAQP